MKKILLASVSSLLLVTAPMYAVAQDAAQPAENAADSAGNAMDNAAEATGNAAGNAADATGNAMDNAGDAAGNAADATGNAMGNAADATGNAASNAADATGNAMDNASQSADTAMSGDMGAATLPTDAMMANTVMGAAVYRVTSGDLSSINEDTPFNSEWEEIGDVGNMVLSQDGQLEGLVLSIGGFLNIGAKDLYLTTDSYKLIPRNANAEQASSGEASSSGTAASGTDQPATAGASGDAAGTATGTAATDNAAPAGGEQATGDMAANNGGEQASGDMAASGDANAEAPTETTHIVLVTLTDEQIEQMQGVEEN